MAKAKAAKKKPNPFNKKKGKRKTGKSVEKKKLDLSPEERKRRSEEMKKKQEEGKVGAKFGKLGGRPKKKRASEVVAEEAAKHAEEIAKVFKDGMEEHMPQGLRQKAAEGFLKVEEKEARLQMDEEEHIAKMGRDELLGELEALFSRNPMIMEMFKGAAVAAASNREPPKQVENQATVDGDEEITEAEVVND